MEVGTEEGIGIGVETEVEAGTDLETGVTIEGLDIMAGIQEHDDPNAYFVLYSLIYLVLPKPFY